MAVSVATAMLLGAVFAGDSVWTAIAVLAVAGGWGALALAGRTPLPGGGTVLLGLVLAIGAWSGLSVAWSVAPDLSWADVNRTLVLAGFLAVGLLLGASGRTACRWAAAALVTALGAAVLWALAGKAIPALFPDGGRVARLRDPIGYWNALALAADMLLVLGSAAGGGRTTVARAASRGCRARVRRGRRGAPRGFTGRSRSGGVGSRAVALAPPRPGRGCAARARRRRPGRSRRRLGFHATCARRRRASARRSRRRRRLVRSAAPRGRRTRGLRSACRLRPLEPKRRALFGRVLGGLAVAGVAVAAIAVLVNAGRIADEFGGAEVKNDPTRFTSLSSNNRSAWWGEAWHVFRGRPGQRSRREHVRGRAQALPRDGVGGVAAAQRSAPVPGRHGARRACALPGARRRRRGRPRSALSGGSRGPSEMRRPPWPSRWRSGSSMRSSTTTGTSSRSPGPRSSPPAFSPQPGGLRAGAPGLARGRGRRGARARGRRVGRDAVARGAELRAGERRARPRRPRGRRATRSTARARSTRSRSQPVFAGARVAEQRRREVAALAGLPRGDEAAAEEPRVVAPARPLRVRHRRPLRRLPAT